MARSTTDWYPLFTAVSLNRLFQILLFQNVLFRQIIIQLSCRDFLIQHLSCNVLCCWQVQMVFSTKAAICVAVLNRYYCFTHTKRSQYTLWTFQNGSGLRTCIQFLHPLIPLTSHNQSIISRIKWNAWVWSTRHSTVRITVFMPPDSHNPTLTSSAPLSLDPPSKVLPSISQLTQWQRPAFVRLWLVVLPICKWDWRASTKAETIPPLTTHRWSQLSRLASLPAAALHSRADRIWRCCGDFAHCTHPSNSSSTSHTVSNIWGIMSLSLPQLLLPNPLTVCRSLFLWTPLPTPYYLLFPTAAPHSYGL